MWYIYTAEYYSAIENNKVMPFAAIQMQLVAAEIIILSNQKERAKYHKIPLTCGI